MKTTVTVLGTNSKFDAAIELPDERNNLTSGYVLVHGVTSDMNEYLDFYKTIALSLARSGVATIRFDLAGHGSRMGESQNLTLNRMVREIASSLEHLTSESHVSRGRLGVFGTSFGGPPAIAAAALYPDLVSRLVLLAPVSDFISLYINPSNINRKQKYAGMLRKALIENAYFPVNGGLYFPPELVFEFATVDVPSLMRQVQCPITILHGTNDGLIPIDLSKRLAMSNPRAEFVPLLNTEHGFTRIGDEVGDDPLTLRNIDTILNILTAE